MKNIVTVVFIALVSYCNAQNQCKIVLVEDHFKNDFTMCNVNRFSSAIYIKGTEAKELVNVLFRDKKLKGFTHKLKKMSISGIESSVNLKIIQGIHGYDKANNSMYFNIYANEADKITRLQNINETEKEGIVIYFKINGSDVISKEYMDHLMCYFKGLVD